MQPIDIARFWMKAREGGGPDPLDPCWKWQGGRLGSGYGQFKLNGYPAYAHRVAWEIIHGPIPEGQQVLHRCDVRVCVKPTHLFMGTQKENIDDAEKKGRREPVHKSRRGENSNWAILNNEKVLDIREMARQGFPQRVIAKKYKISRTTVSLIVNRVNWRHI